MTRRPYGVEELGHRDPACTAGFTAVVDQEPPSYSSQERTTVELRCWSCGATWTLTAGSRADDDPPSEGYVTPPEHRPRLYVGSGTVSRLAASWPAERHGRVLLHPEYLFSRDEVGLWWATDLDGNVLGEVAWYLTDRGATRYRWGTLQDAAGHGEGCKTPGAAARALGEAAGVGRALAATG